MISRKLIVALALLLGVTSAALAQNQQNCGPAGPAQGDCYGQPYSGTAGAKCICHPWHHWRYRYR